MNLPEVSITEAEYATLVKESDREHTVSCVFGPSGATLLPMLQNIWAFKRIKEMRGIQ